MSFGDTLFDQEQQAALDAIFSPVAGERKEPMVRPLIVKLCLLALVLAALPAAAANSVSVTAGAALGTSASDFGLLVTLQDVAPRNATYVMAGPGQGFNDETTLNGSFFINPQNLTMPLSPTTGYFQMIDFLEGVDPGDKVNLIFFLQRSSTTGDWFIAAWHWNETLSGGAGNWQFSGNGFFALDGAPAFSNNRIDFQWNAGNPGHLTMSRTLYTGGVPDPSGTIQMFSVNLPGQTNAVINYVFAGMFAAHSPGTSGTFALDEFVFNR
jgi:hypothetical protein